MIRYGNMKQDAPLLLPPDLRYCLPLYHLVHFLIDAIELIGTGTTAVNARVTGSVHRPPGAVLAMLGYKNATDMFSSPRSSVSVAKASWCACTARTRNPIMTRFAGFAEKPVRCWPKPSGSSSKCSRAAGF